MQLECPKGCWSTVQSEHAGRKYCTWYVPKQPICKASSTGEAAADCWASAGTGPVACHRHGGVQVGGGWVAGSGGGGGGEGEGEEGAVRPAESRQSYADAPWNSAGSNMSFAEVDLASGWQQEGRASTVYCLLSTVYHEYVRLHD
ncbi:hypothetical protein EG329_009795 [Mollisiaceae sp. DMI_Dod_QoI]|nr:hypothetical protein EG329_009795 [Helotiales sp. DMI_Dod_QoI]